MIRIILAVLVIISLISCTTARNIKNSEEIYSVLNAFNERKAKLQKIYFQSVNTSPNFPHISRREFIKQPEKMIVDNYNQNYMEIWLSKIDSITSVFTSHKKDSVVNIVNRKFRINPDELFSEEDKYYMLSQFNQNNIKWKKVGLTSLNLTKSEKSTKVSIPLFSKDHQLSVIFVTLPGFEGIEVYKRQLGGWKYYFGSTILIE